jgi:hypothetical protein
MPFSFFQLTKIPGDIIRVKMYTVGVEVYARVKVDVHVRVK